jgi:hypothetical protein
MGGEEEEKEDDGDLKPMRFEMPKQRKLEN